MKLTSIRLNPKNIKFSGVFNEDNGEAKEIRSVTCEERPKPELEEALRALTVVVVDVLGVAKEWVNEMVVKGFTLSETKNGTRSMQIIFSKALDKMGGESHQMNTPMFRIDEPADCDSGSLLIGNKLAGLCAHAITEAKSYAGGDRAQMTFKEWNEQNSALAKKASEEEQTDSLV